MASGTRTRGTRSHGDSTVREGLSSGMRTVTLQIDDVG
jgi:hypothetical protein